ncbi:MAG: hypothetical protein ACTSPQ_18380 [Candidatus Helarchaeota archaeon]
MKIIFLIPIIFVLLLIFFGIVLFSKPNVPPNPDFCGNGVCEQEVGETPENCPSDCKSEDSCNGICDLETYIFTLGETKEIDEYNGNLEKLYITLEEVNFEIKTARLKIIEWGYGKKIIRGANLNTKSIYGCWYYIDDFKIKLDEIFSEDKVKLLVGYENCKEECL